MKNKLFRAFTVLISLTLMFNVMFPISSSAATKAELEDKIESIETKRKEQEEKLAELRKDATKQAQYVDGLYKQLAVFQQEMDAYQEKINVLNDGLNEINKKIEEKNKEISKIEKKKKAKEAEIKEIKAKLAVRLRATYMAGSGSTLKLLLSADNLASYLTTSEMIRRIADNDDRIVKSLIKTIEVHKKLIKDLDEQKNELEKEQKVLNQKKTEYEEEFRVFQDKQTELTNKYHEAYDILITLDKESQYFRNQIQYLDKEQANIEAQIQAVINASRPSTGGSSGGSSSGGSSSGGSSSGGYTPTLNPSGYINPVADPNRYMSSPYGYRTDPISGERKLHGGMDITCPGAGGRTGPFTKKIVAAKSGTVSFAGWMSGYGNTVMISHSDGFTTLYAHNYSLTVSAGQPVSQGQQISIMGTTGYSTGAHCHFEIRDSYGNKINPAPYI
ncbi:MAG: peptidoglycan DD-metalloendopeptidase family protein [Clostridia bacterium]|nr:peptidoglycan DD-metalloendopeptidase family protein [Clostridia bacterium]